MKIALVVQRYGAGIAGGSETLCRQYAERLTAHHDVTVLTSCAHDYVTWSNALSPGVTSERGVTVRRFPAARERNPGRFRDLSALVFGAAQAPRDLEDAWFRENGPEVPALIDHLRAHGTDYDRILFFTFRYYPSYFGLPVVADRAILVPTAEEDPAIQLGVLETFFALPAGYIFMTPEEGTLVATSAGGRLAPGIVTGIGIDPPPPAPARSVLDSLGIPERFILCLGRVDKNKGAHTLAEFFVQHLAGGGEPATLVFAGPATIPLPAHDRIRALGFVSQEFRDALLAHAALLVVPSPFESLSIALLEAWNHGVPALVNGHCRVLGGQVARAGGGLAYRSPLEFSESLDYLLTHPDEARHLGAQGRAYVDHEYRWPVVMERVESVLNRPLRK
ncbi:MAG: glycosyltransferase family 4 protein [Vicinamibacterales bacterium]|nr:glycosyltransferase family 4 protein [Vicinamibacterales bacterium]